MVKVVPEGEELVGTKDEKNPPSRGWHGSLKEDCVTVWFYKEISAVMM